MYSVQLHMTSQEIIHDSDLDDDIDDVYHDIMTHEHSCNVLRQCVSITGERIDLIFCVNWLLCVSG